MKQAVQIFSLYQPEHYDNIVNFPHLFKAG